MPSAPESTFLDFLLADQGLSTSEELILLAFKTYTKDKEVLLAVCGHFS